MSRFVLDASTVLTWCFPDEKAQKAQEVSERIAFGDTVIVPSFWRHEILNALVVGEKRKRLEIAVRDRCPLATTDDDLRRAAVSEGVQVL